MRFTVATPHLSCSRLKDQECRVQLVPFLVHHLGHAYWLRYDYGVPYCPFTSGPNGTILKSAVVVGTSLEALLSA